MNNELHPELEVLTRKEVQQKVRRARSTLCLWEKKGSRYFDPSWPKPFPTSRRRIGYFKHEVDEWLRIKAAKRGACHE